MSEFRIFETRQFEKDLKGEFGGDAARVIRKLRTVVYPLLRVNPYFGPNIKKLCDFKPPTWRYRIGSYRFFYEIDDREGIVSMIAADARKDAYR